MLLFIECTVFVTSASRLYRLVEIFLHPIWCLERPGDSGRVHTLIAGEVWTTLAQSGFVYCVPERKLNPSFSWSVTDSVMKTIRWRQETFGVKTMEILDSFLISCILERFKEHSWQCNDFPLLRDVQRLKWHQRKGNVQGFFIRSQNRYFYIKKQSRKSCMKVIKFENEFALFDVLSLRKVYHRNLLCI